VCKLLKPRISTQHTCSFHSHCPQKAMSPLLLLSYVWVTAGSSTLTRLASLQAWQISARTVEWHHTPLNICSSALPAQNNWQLKTYGTIQMRWQIFSSSTTTDEKRGAVGYNNNNNNNNNNSTPVAANLLLSLLLIQLPPISSPQRVSRFLT